MPYEDMREKDLTPEMESSIARRRFGNRHDEPCRGCGVMTCSLWRCQVAGYCQLASDAK